jgi:hypothetical protein
MNISLDIIISTASALFAIAVAYSVVKVKVGLFEKEIDILQLWKDRHIEDQNERTRQIEKELAELRGMMNVGSEQYKEIIRRLTVIEVKIERRREDYFNDSKGEPT